MAVLEARLAMHRAERDAALRRFKDDLAIVRGDLDARGVGTRVADRVGDAALDTLDDAVDYAQDHRGQLAAGAAALVLFLFRGPLLDLLASLLGVDEEDWEDEAEPG